MVLNEIYYIGRANPKWVIKYPIYLNTISAGFPSPANDEQDTFLDLNQLLAQNGEATFFFKIKSHAMEDIGVLNGDTIVVDRSIIAEEGHIVIGSYKSNFIIRRLIQKVPKFILKSENNNYPLIEADSEDFVIWGVVTFIIRELIK